MAVISPVLSRTTEGIPYLIWDNAATADTEIAYALLNRLGTDGAVSFTGTFGGATVKLQASNDGTNFFDMKDKSGTTISATAGALFTFDTSAAYIRPAITGGTGDSIDIIVVLRGPASSV
jgi:hypothetical protein